MTPIIDWYWVGAGALGMRMGSAEELGSCLLKSL